LIKVIPLGPVCHTGADTCFNEINTVSYDWIKHLEAVIEQRQKSGDSKSYVASLFEKGINKIAQKVGEEAVEVVIEAKDDNEELFLNESADLLFHYLILLQAKGYKLSDVLEILKSREK
jgi:phosphoribosyl-ATP pyrophosphohydrolase/phosphoribosyl-AMP cyclohydrolase